MSLISFFNASIDLDRNYYYTGGFPNIKNLGDIALYESMEMLLDEKLVPYPGGKRYRYLANMLPRRKSILSGGTIINRHTLFAISEMDKISKDNFCFGTGVTQREFWKDFSDFSDNSDKWKKYLENFNYIGVRGPLSKKELEEYGLTNIEVFGDPVLQMQIDINKNYNEKCIGINIGQSGGKVWGTEDKIKSQYIKLINLLKGKYKIKWFVVCPEDEEITRFVAKETSTEEDIFSEYTYSDKFIKEASEMMCFIGLKLHSVVLAQCANIPSIMIEYRPKCLDHMLSLDLGKYNFRSDNINTSEILKLVEEIKDSRETLVLDIYNKVQKIKKTQKAKVKYVLNQ